MNVYDFDKTIYLNDSTAEFIKFLIGKKFSIVRHFPGIGYNFLKYKLKKQTKTQFKEKMYMKLFSSFDSLCEYVDEFWNIKEKNIKKWYLEQQKDDDVIISASPYFLLEPVCRKLNIKTLMASNVDPKTGKYDGVNCSGEEKVRRYREVFGDAVIEEFYSDSYSDTPLALIAQKSFLVTGDKRENWNK